MDERSTAPGRPDPPLGPPPGIPGRARSGSLEGRDDIGRAAAALANGGRRPSLPDIVAIAAGQHGVVSRRQLLDAGVTPGRVDGHVRAGRLRVLHRGVYAIAGLSGPLEPPGLPVMAAVVACGPGAVVSHESAAALSGLVPPARYMFPVHVTVPGADRGRRAGIRPHRVASLPAEETTEVDGIPVTSPGRTLVDLAGRVRPRTLEQALATAIRRELIDPAALADSLERRPAAPGIGVLRGLLTRTASPAFARSRAEERLLRLIRSGGLPAPRLNQRVAEYEVDFLWPSEKTIIEVDGFAFHSSRRSFERDRRRDARLAAAGYRVVRTTWDQLQREPAAVLVNLAQTLATARRED